MCRAAASGLEADFVTYEPYGYIVITAASEDARYAAADAADLHEWSTYYGLTHPVVLDSGALVDRLYDPTARSRPTYVLLGPGAEILSIGSSVSDADIEAALPTPYP